MDSLIFLTSTTSAIPQGRNARVRTRALEHATHSPAQAQGAGRFACFALDKSSTVEAHRRLLKRGASSESQASSRVASRPKPMHSALTFPPRGVDHEAILALARFHIARTGVRMALSKPDRLGDTLLWRHWTRAIIAPIAVGGRTACVDRALVCLSVKLNDLLVTRNDGASSAQVLACHDQSLVGLTRAFLGFDAARPEDLMATAQLLAIFEMLHNPGGDSWVKHAIGTVSLMMSSKNKHSLSATSGWPILSAALLDSGRGPYANAPRRALADLVLAETATSPYSELEPIIKQTAALVDRRWAVSASTSVEKNTRLALLASAHSLRDQLISMATTMNRASRPWRRPHGDDFDYLGFGLVCLVALDRMIMTLRPPGPRPFTDIDEETHAVCTQVLGAEVNAVENNPTHKDQMQQYQ